MKLADFRGVGRKALVFHYGAVLDEVFCHANDGWTFGNDRELVENLKRVARLSLSERVMEMVPDDLWETEWNTKLGEWASKFEEGSVSR